MPEQKTNTETPVKKEIAPPLKKSNNTVIWVLVGCLGVVLLTGIIVLGLLVWGGWHLKKKVDQARPEFEKLQETANEMQKQADQFGQQMESISDQSQSALENGQNPSEGNILPPEPDTSEGAAPFSGEKQIGYVKKVYTKAGKNYLDIDYIQWLTGAAAQKAMREDGACPKTGECIVYNDYYIRNQNPLIRTFEISPTVDITMQTYSMETTGQIQAQKISFAQFSQIFASSAWSHLKDAPYIVEISSNQIVRITEQYIP